MNNEMGNVIAKKKKERLEKCALIIINGVISSVNFNQPVSDVCKKAVTIAKELIRQLDEEEI